MELLRPLSLSDMERWFAEHEGGAPSSTVDPVDELEAHLQQGAAYLRWVLESVNLGVLGGLLTPKDLGRLRSWLGRDVAMRG